jgi:signal transduction histidine kinase
MRAVLLFILSLLTAPVYGQTQPAPAADSLLQVLATSPADTSQVSTLLALANLYNKKDSPQALYYAKKAFALARQHRYTSGEIRAMIQLGRAHTDLKQADSALLVYEDALALSRKTNNYRLEIKVLESLANQNSHSGSSYKSEGLLNQYEAVLATARKQGDSLAVANIYYNIAVIQYGMGNKDRFLELAYSSLNLYEAYNGPKKMVMSVVIDIGSILDQQGKLPQALEYYYRGLAMAEALDDKFGLVRVLNNLGNFFGKKKEYEQALKNYSRGQQVAAELGNVMLSTYLLHNMGNIYLAQKNPEQAKQAFLKSYRTRQANNLTCIMASDLASLGSCYLKLYQPDSANFYAEQALSISQSCNNPQLIMRSKRLLGDVNLARGQAAQAIPYFKEAEQQALAISATQELHEIKKQLYLSYKRLGRHAQSLTYLEEATAMQDSLQNDENTKKLAMLEAEYHFNQEKKELEYEKEKEQLGLQARIAEQETKQQASLLGLGLAGLLLIALGTLFYQKRKANFLLSSKNVKIKSQRDKIKHQWRELDRYKVELEERVEELDTQNEKIEKQKREVERSYRTVTTLSQLGQNITATLDLKSIIETLYHSIDELMQVDSFGVGLADEARQVLYFKHAFEEGRELPEFEQDLTANDKIAVWSYKTGNEVFINDLYAEYSNYMPFLPPAHPAGKQYSESVIYVPLRIKDKVVGVITVQSFRKQAYRPHHLDILRTLAAYTAIALDNAHAYSQLNEINGELSTTLTNLKETQAQLVQSERMASLGQLTAGVAHEINNPINFVSAGIDSLTDNYKDLSLLLEKFAALKPGDDNIALLHEIEDLKQELELDYLLMEVPQLLQGIKTGAQRTSEIVKGLRNFTRLDEQDLKQIDIHEGLNSTLTLLRPKIDDRIAVETHYGEAPLIYCYPGQLNQVFMHVLSNAVQAIDGSGTVKVSTTLVANSLHIIIADTGRGMTPEVQQRIFEPFFTTKEVGEGTGLGLAITYSIIEKHQGSISVSSQPGQGTEITIKLPLQLNFMVA